MIFERERLQVGVKIRAQFQERLQTGLHENVIAGEIGQSPQNLNADQRQTEQGNEVRRRTEPGVRISRQDIVNDVLERPGLEQIQRDSAERKEEAEESLREERPIVLEHAAVNRHDKN